MISINFDKVLTPVNVYRFFLFIVLILAAIKSDFVTNGYTFLQVLLFIPICIYLLTTRKLWVKKIEKKDKYEKTIKEIIFKREKKGFFYFFNIGLFYFSNMLIIFISIVSLTGEGLK
jgi:general stress protein CsbA